MRKNGHIQLNPLTWFRKSEASDVDEDEAESSSSSGVPTWWWVVGLLASIIMPCAITSIATMFEMNSSGYTDINPISTVAKASHFVFGGISKGKGMPLKPAQTYNLTAGTIAAGAASQSVDMTGGLKTGYLLRAKPRNQLIAQFFGAIVACVLSCGLFVLFTKASPCVLYPADDSKSTYGAPFVAAWAAALTAFVRQFFIPKNYWSYIPSWNAIGLAFVIPQVLYLLAMAVGSTFAYFWQRNGPGSYGMYKLALSAGPLAGEGLGGVFQALLAVLKVDKVHYGTAIGCPGFAFCG